MDLFNRLLVKIVSVVLLCIDQGYCKTCLENGRFYRDPERSVQNVWSEEECSRYLLCIEGEVFEFRCSSGLLFDVDRQICDFQSNVDNCDINTETTIPKPLLQNAGCPKNHLGCGDGSCLPSTYFCDGSTDCPDSSDEGHCDPKHDSFAAEKCKHWLCKLPECFCSEKGTQIPGNLMPSETPQMVLITFDGPITDSDIETFENIFKKKRTNPNNCPITATFFISHQNNDYRYTQKLWSDGHEIAVNSITHRSPGSWWSRNATIEDWFDEMVGQANILNRFSKIRMKEIAGLRVPYLQIGWNRQFLMMKEFGFLYDSSIIAPFSNPPLWPFTLDFKVAHNCTEYNQLCPTRSYPGLWEMIVNPIEADGFTCVMIDSCPDNLGTDEIYQLLMHNFNRHYLTNRAPFGLYLHSSWFKNPEYFNAFEKFVEEILGQPDVWFITNQQAIQWMKNPMPVSYLHTYEPWKCRNSFNYCEIPCRKPNMCNVYSRVFQENRLFKTCTECPNSYPWIRNEFGSD